MLVYVVAGPDLAILTAIVIALWALFQGSPSARDASFGCDSRGRGASIGGTFAFDLYQYRHARCG